MRVHVLDGDRPDRIIHGARVILLRIERVPPGGGKYPSDLPADGCAETDAQGVATIERVLRTATYIQVMAPGFTMARRTIPAADEAVTEVRIDLLRGAVVGGTVRNADGTAAAGAHVRGTQPEQWGWSQYSPGGVTDARGAFLLSGMFPGSVSLRATLRNEDAAWVGETTAEAGREDVEIRLPAEPVRRRIRILVKGTDGLPVPSARLDVPDDLSWTGHSSHGEIHGGVFVLPPDPDIQYVCITPPGDRDARPWAPIVVGPLGSREADLEVVLSRGVTISGTVRDEHGKPLSNVFVFARPLIERRGIERVTFGSRSWSHAVSDVKGRFRIDGVGPGRVEIEPHDEGWVGEPQWGNSTTGPLEFTMVPLRRLRVHVRHDDGTPAPEAALWVLGPDDRAAGWSRGSVSRRDGGGNFLMAEIISGELRLRAGLPPSGAEDMAASEVTVGADADPGTIVLTVPPSRDLAVHIPDWPATVPGAARLANGPYSPGASEWIVDGTATFEGIDARAPLSVYCGPLPDGRIAFARDIPVECGEVVLPLIPSRSIRGRARGFPYDSEADSAWADTSQFEARGRVSPDGAFVIPGVPPGACRVCVVFRRGQDVWAGSVQDTGSAEQVEVEVQLMRTDQADLSEWIYPRPSP